MIAEIFPYWNIVFLVLTAIYAITIVTAIGVVISENRNPVKTIAWVVVLLLVPVVGVIIYAFFGRSMKNMLIINRKSKQLLSNKISNTGAHASLNDMSPENQQIIALANSLVEPHLFSNNEITIFTEGRDKFDALKHDILAAKQFIHLQYYIFENDNIGKEIGNLLITKAKQGVKVRVIYDHVGSWHIDMSFLNNLRAAGVEAYPFLKVTFPEFANRINWRNHRKVTVIDGKVGYIGGMNIADRYVTGDKNGPAWRDTHLRITGNALAALQYSFAIDWNFMRGEILPEIINATPAKGSDHIQIVTSGPNNKWSNIAMIFHKAITNAKQRVLIQTPYFLPSDYLLKAIESAALSGVNVEIMIPKNPDSKLLRHASASYIEECLEAGVKIHYYQGRMLHAKCVIIDNDFVTTGSTNFDFRSFEHNFECNVLIYSKEFNKRMASIFHNDTLSCTPVDINRWQHRSKWQKACESLTRLMAPLL